MARLRDIGNVWKTIKEIDVQGIRDEAEQALRITLVGPAEVRSTIAQLLRAGSDRYPPAGADPLEELAVPLARQRQGGLSHADLLIQVMAADKPLSSEEHLTYEKLLVVGVPLLVAVVGGSTLPSLAQAGQAPNWRGQRAVFLTRPDAPETPEQLAEALVELLPQELRLAAARRLPGLRRTVSHQLIRDTAFSNATYALTSGLPELIPLLNLPLSAADMLVLTKNQALLVYRLALALGASPSFSAQMQEILPVVGGAFLWRQLARQLVGLLPGVGLLPKVAVSYAGTYTVGMVAMRWYAHHEATSRRDLRSLMAQALNDGKERAQELIAGRGARETILKTIRALPGRVIRRLPGRKNQSSEF